MTILEDEKTMLRTAKRIRKLVHADLQKTANPAIMMLLRGIGPMLTKLGPQVMNLAKNIPPDAWGNIAQVLMKAMSGAAGGGEKAASVKSNIDSHRNDFSLALKKLGYSYHSELADAIVIATVQSVANHRKTPNVSLAKAYKLSLAAKDELALLRDFI